MVKYDKRSGCDNLRAEHFKYAPSKLLEEIAMLLNNVAETGLYPKEIKTGDEIPLQKGKPKGPPENLRPVILLSTLRNILAICLTKRISGRLHLQKIIPITQTAYTSNRNITELVFTFKVLAKKAILSIGYEIKPAYA